MRKALLALVAVFVLTACGIAGDKDITTARMDADSNASAADQASWTADAPDLNPDQVVAALGGHYNTVGTLEPDEFMRLAQVKKVLVGTVADFSLGPKLFADEESDRFAVRTVVMKVRVTEMIKGTAPSSEAVYVQLPGNDDAAAASAALPTGAVVALYLSLPPQTDPAVKVRDAQAGRPVGEPVWLASPLAFVAADGPDDGIVLPSLGESYPDRSFASQLPTAVRERP